ncbi:ArsC family reductase [Altererythrobacter salegens]|uniref:ArsC family reductase n=1 Tax=Croceibacterium salegens TaxID=1737568 RepID=A0A6I4T0R3_9SPHN|nr:ArsC family reductase [Croceibacterium salegens]MXO61189.1 ArsC family reductase [Croceibacterium salegens]
MSIQFYGIPNCDTVKKARKWLEEQGVAYDFHDYKKEGADPNMLRHWAGAVGWEALLNRRGTTFRGLPEADREGIDKAKAVALMAAHPSLIKRPVVIYDNGLLVGFDTDQWDAALC